VLASPLLMATVAATVADGTWRPPVLLPDHAHDGGGLVQMEPDAARALARMMRLVVTDGTGEALRDVPGEPVYAKTGTAEYGQDAPPRTHAWVIAYQDDLAVAVLIEDGGAGGAVAAPVAADFLRRL
jgi:cell division protein FtsI/penicillin-binding protein 2